MKEKKTELRKQIAHLKTRYCDSTLKRMSAEIMAGLENHPAFLQAKTLLLYHSLPDEVNTHGFIDKWASRKNILLPVVCGDSLKLCLYQPAGNMRTGAYGILEPEGDYYNEFDVINLVVVPGVAFDINGNRLGRGKGYYDKLLPGIKAYKIGICFPFQLIGEVPAEITDIKMDEVLTIRPD